MTDKERQEFVDRYAEKFNVTENNILVLLADYDKLNGDRLERLKEFVEADLERATAISDDAFYDGIRIEARSILAEISRLEKEGK
jgi:hypothetical protein